MNYTALNDTSTFGLWFEHRQTVFAFVGFLFFLFVVLVFSCGCLTFTVVACWTECGHGIEKARREKETLVRWRKCENDKNFGLNISRTDSNKMCDILDPRQERQKKSYKDDNFSVNILKTEGNKMSDLLDPRHVTWKR